MGDLAFLVPFFVDVDFFVVEAVLFGFDLELGAVLGFLVVVDFLVGFLVVDFFVDVDFFVVDFVVVDFLVGFLVVDFFVDVDFFVVDCVGGAELASSV